MRTNPRRQPPQQTSQRGNTRTKFIARVATIVLPSQAILDSIGPDNDDVLVPSQPALAVYVNPWGQIVIRQEGEIFEDDSWVIIGQAHVPALIEKLQDLISDTDLANP